MYLVKVALKVAHNNGVFTYKPPDGQALASLWGRRVKVRLGTRLLTGVVIGYEPQDSPLKYQIKTIDEVLDEQPIITQEQLNLMEFCARYYFNDLGTCVHLAVPRNEKKYRLKKISSSPQTTHEHILNDRQKQAADSILAADHGAFLLEGVTGSGKTHVYITVAASCLKAGQSVLFIVPEIALTPQLVERVEEALGLKVAIIHSNISPAQKRDAIFHLLSGQTRVLIGARSAIFAPMPNLGLIVVDEEHDGSFKQDESPRYHARDLALWRAKHEKARLILGSATPSLESILNVERKKLKHLVLSERFQLNRALPSVDIIDLKERANDVDHRSHDQSMSTGSKLCILSRPLVIAMRQTLSEHQQVLLFLNQRGYARFGVCYGCGHMVECPNCSVGLTYYQRRQSLLCHQCQHVETVKTTCTNCLKDTIRYVGLGTERLEEEVKLLFPKQQVIRLDRDVITSQIRLEKALSAMHERTADILIGTQMLAKGHNFLHVGLVGVVCADVSLSMPDFRAGEKTFQLLTQVAGRAGRGQYEGRAIIQTFNPLHPSIYFAKTHDVSGFIAQELPLRKRFGQPPFSRAALIRCEHRDQDLVKLIINQAHQILQISGLNLLGPSPSPIERTQNRYRWQVLALSSSAKHLHEAIYTLKLNSDLRANINKNKARFIIDIDPY